MNIPKLGSLQPHEDIPDEGLVPLPSSYARQLDESWAQFKIECRRQNQNALKAIWCNTENCSLLGSNEFKSIVGSW